MGHPLGVSIQVLALPIPIHVKKPPLSSALLKLLFVVSMVGVLLATNSVSELQKITKLH